MMGKIFDFAKFFCVASGLLIIRSLIFLGFIIFVVFLLMVIGKGVPREQVSPEQVSPAVADFTESREIREMLSPSVYWIKTTVYVTETPEKIKLLAKKDLSGKCVGDFGTAWTVSEKGYFVTNDHVVQQKSAEETCIEKLSASLGIKKEDLAGLKFRVSYSLADSEKNFLRVNLVHSWWPLVDMALLQVDQSYQERQRNALGERYKEPKFVPVEFRTGSPSIVHGKVISGKGPMILPDEPVAVLGMPLFFSYVLAKGTLGPSLFSEGKETFFQFTAPVYHGTSGAPVLSLLDRKVIGMMTLGRTDSGSVSQIAGAVPFWVIQKALNEIDMK
jgi:hypothetical protein